MKRNLCISSLATSKTRVSGAASVAGIDFNRRLIDFAIENLKENHPQFGNAVRFTDQPLDQWPEESFVLFTSKDAFERVLDPASLLAGIRRRLKPGGRAMLGFGPLHNSPFGDHGRTRIPIPWGHVRIPNGCGLKIVYWKINQSAKPLVSAAFQFASAIPFCRECLTLNICCILEKERPPGGAGSV